MASHIYIALDCSSSILLNFSDKNSLTAAKFNRAKAFAGHFVEQLLADGGEENFELDLISLSSSPKIVSKSAKTRQDVFDTCFGKTVTGKLDFLALRDLVLTQNSITNFELIILLDGTHRIWIPTAFRLPCPVHFIVLADQPDSVSGHFLADLCAISASCQPNSDSKPPFVLSRDEQTESAAKELAALPRLHPTATLVLAPSKRIEVRLVPQMQRAPLISYDEQRIVRRIPPTAKGNGSQQPPPRPSFRLLGFTKSDTLASIPSSSLCHIVRPEAPRDSDDWNWFHVMAEVLGSDGQCAVLRDERSGEQFVLRPFRDDPTTLWMLCLQLIPTATIRWKATKPSKVLYPEVSYKQGASTRVYWTDSYGLQSDLQRLQRLLKRADRVEQFRHEVRRMATYASAFGYHSFAGQFADVLDRKLASASTPNECKPVLQRTIQLLREGGFRVVMQNLTK